jgi:acyl-coenzyme A synthetase/AMP-(fatty) acid ligase
MRATTEATILSREQRQRLAADPNLGAGNFLHHALLANPQRDLPLLWLERPYRAATGEVFSTLSLSELKTLVDRMAGFYHRVGVRPRDPIGVFVEEGVESFIHLMALTALGAIAIMVNSDQKPEIAGYLRRIGAVGAFLEPAREAAVRAHLGAAVETMRFIAGPATAAALGGELPARYPYVHAPDDVCYLCHSSGTTGLPKPVIMSHAQHFVGARRRLGATEFNEGDRILSMMPHTHAVGIAHFIFAIVSGTPFAIVSDASARPVIAAIEAFRPAMVLGFSRTYAELAELDLEGYDLTSVERWFNTADSAHEKHVRAIVKHGSHVEGGKRAPGSSFIDMLGSSEMALPVFQKVHTWNSNAYGRAVGKPNPIVEAAVLDPHGTPLGPHCVGRIAVKSPATTAGYWNDSLATCQRRQSGYWLMDDLGYRDEEGVYYHVDRVGDEIKTPRGDVYTLPIEEIIMQTHHEVLDTFVVAMRTTGPYAEPLAIAYLTAGSALTERGLLELFNARLRASGQPVLARVVIAKSRDEWPVGPTGKVIKHALRDRFDSRRTPPPAPNATNGASP